MLNWWDTLRNLVTGLGTIKDPTHASEFHLHVLSREQLENAYRGDWIARKIVDAPPEDCTREWRQWQATNAQIEAIEDTEKTHGLQQKVKRAMIRGRLYGGGALVVGVDDGNRPDEPVDLEKVGKDSLKFVVVLNRHELNAGPRIYDVESPWYTRPEYYTVATPMFGFGRDTPRNTPPLESGSGSLTSRYAGIVRIHPSRVVEFSGNELPDWRLEPMGGGWGDSVLQTAFDTLKDLGMVVGGTAAMVNDAKMDVVKIPGLSKGLSNKDYSSKLLERFTLANQSKSIINTLLLDKDEEWERITSNFGGLPVLIHEYLTIMAGAGGIPMSRLFGESRSRGLGEGGAVNGGNGSDLRNYYDSQASYQKTTLTPIMNPLDQILLRSATGSYDPNVFYEWSPLWQTDKVTDSEIALRKAQTTQIYVSLGMLNEEVLAEAMTNQLIEDGTYPGLEMSIAKHGLLPEQVSAPWQPTNGGGAPQPPRRLTGNVPKESDVEGTAKLQREQTTDANAAGVMFVDPDGCLLLTRRVGEDDPHAGEWSIPAGMLEQDEEPMRGAQREAAEEVGYGGDHAIRHLETRAGDGNLTFHTFVQPVREQFQPVLNEEHDEYVWAPLGDLPSPLHPGLAATLRARRVTGDAGPPDEPRDQDGKWTSGGGGGGVSSSRFKGSGHEGALTRDDIDAARDKVTGIQWKMSEFETNAGKVKRGKERQHAELRKQRAAAQSHVDKLEKHYEKHINETRKYLNSFATSPLVRSSAAFAHDNYKKDEFGLTIPESAVIATYANEGYKKLNKSLRSAPDMKSKKFKAELEKALRKIPTRSGTTWRGAPLTQKQAQLYKVGGVIKESGFTSTSKSRDVAERFANVYGDHYAMFKIVGKSGHDIGKLLSQGGGDEDEVLYKPGVKFKVVENKVKPRHSGPFNSRFQSLITLQEVD